MNNIKNVPLSALHASPVAVMIHDLDNRVLFLNRAAERLFGWQQADALGEFPPFVPETEREKFKSATEQLLRTGRGEFGDTWRVDSTGAPVEVRVSAELLRDDANTPFGIIRFISDVTRVKKLEAELSAQARRYKQVIEHPRDAYIEMGSDGNVTAWNARAEALFGWQKSEAIGRELAELIIPPKLRSAHWKGLKRFLETGQGDVLERKVEVDAIRRDGVSIPVELTVNATFVAGAPRFYAFLHDVRERQQRQQDLRLGLYDALTSLPGRTLLHDRIEQVVTRGVESALLLVDVNKLRTLNELYGTRTGDKALLAVADRLKSAIREHDTVARLANDEFAILLAPITGSASVVPALLKSIYEKVSGPAVIDGKSLQLSVSIGGSVYGASIGSPAEFLRQANEALRAAKTERCGFKLYAANA